MLRLPVLWIALGIAPVFAASEMPSACDVPIDLREAGGPLEDMSPTTQGYNPTNLCGFYAFSNYLDGYRVARNGERGASMVRSSPVGIGVENALRWNLPYWMPIQNSTDPLNMTVGRWGSTFCALANAVREMGYCADPELPTRTPDATAKFADVTTATYADLMEIAETPRAARAGKIAAKIEGIYARYAEWAGSRGTIAFEKAHLRELIERNATQPYATIRAVFFARCGDPALRRDDFRFSACKSEVFLGLDALGLGRRGDDPLRTDRAANRVAELLARPRALPVPFAYCSSVLDEGKRYSGRSPLSAGCWIHWSLIVGRRRIGNDCYLLVHNSWSPDETYSKDWMVDRGDIWVREKELTRAMLMAEWLEE